MKTGVALLPETITAAWIDTYRSQIPSSLLAYINFDKEINSLAHSVMGRYVLWQLLNAENIDSNNIVMSLSDHKRPLINVSFHFSISHSGRVVVCAISDSTVPGIDIELIKDIDITNFKMHFSGEEYGMIVSDRSMRTFYRLWTAKEAICKAIGKGLYIDPGDIRYISANKYQLDGVQWHITDIPVNPQYCCSLATDTSVPEPQLMWFQLG